jgi:succinate-acetate transporter protein
MALYLFIWGVFSFIMFVGTILHKRPWMLSFVFLTVVVLFSLLASFHWSLDEGVEKAAGVEGIICGLSAIYMAAAIMWNSFAGRTILWVGNRE